MDAQQLEAAIAATPGEKVTKDYINSRIKYPPRFERIGVTLTHCSIEVDNGFIVTGESSCVDPQNYRQEIGEQIAYDNAYAKLWPLFGFLLAEKRMLASRLASFCRTEPGVLTTYRSCTSP